MCGIIGAASSRSVGKILVNGLKKMEYRGYDSAGLILNQEEKAVQIRTLGKVSNLEEAMVQEKPKADSGIAHTRWATHGAPSEANAHPHGSCDNIYIVHNGIIENHNDLREQLTNKGYAIKSETDSELIAHLIHSNKSKGKNTLEALIKTTKELDGAYSIAVIDTDEKGKVFAAKQKSPLLVGKGIEENFVASDPLAIAGLAESFYLLEDGDFAEITKTDIRIFGSDGNEVNREETPIDTNIQEVTKDGYKHFMEKEIYEQPEAISRAVEGRTTEGEVLDNIFGLGSSEAFKNVKRIQFVACGTSLHAAKTARKWFEELCETPCYIDFASEYRYRNPLVEDHTLFVCISQSGETADTMAALNYAKEKKYLGIVTICNVPTSTMARESDWKIFTNAGPEIGVASTKAFTTQLAALLLLACAISKIKKINNDKRANAIDDLHQAPDLVKESFGLKKHIDEIVEKIADKKNALYLGRGVYFSIAQEGALKLKEISYIHAEAYPAGELKHGPLALVDEMTPVVALAPEDELVEKLLSNLEEVKSRGGTLYVFGNSGSKIKIDKGKFMNMPECGYYNAPIVYTIPLQILAYEVACSRGTDLDQPRNLAKSVTVE
ncbi:MAG: glutamine--fructose-6-phosphate transaminase (isomerizing) [Gammaproteobacteria bacterium]|nr:glutamine--fructose-6-phosphate transaminase (isomerizing) [Gammaproteobacteria bacterium]